MHGFTGTTMSFAATWALMTGVVAALSGSTMIAVVESRNEVATMISTLVVVIPSTTSITSRIVEVGSRASMAAASGASRFEKTQYMNTQLSLQV